MRVDFKEVYLLYPDELKLKSDVIYKEKKDEKTVSLSIEELEERLNQTQSLHM